MIERNAVLVLLAAACMACGPTSEEGSAPVEQVAAPSVPKPAQAEADASTEATLGPSTIRLTEEEIQSRYRSAGSEQLLADHGEPLSRAKVPFKDWMERWTWPADLDHGGRRAQRISFRLRYGKYISAYGFPDLVPRHRRDQVMMEDELTAAVFRRPAQAALKAVGEPDWIHLRADGKTAWEYSLWIQRGTTQFSAVILYPGDDGIVSSYSFEKEGRREVAD